MNPGNLSATYVNDQSNCKTYFLQEDSLNSTLGRSSSSNSRSGSVGLGSAGSGSTGGGEGVAGLRYGFLTG